MATILLGCAILIFLLATQLADHQIFNQQGKPKPSDTDSLYALIPDCDLAIRIFNGGVEKAGQWCFDFFDVDALKPLDTPEGWEIQHTSQDRAHLGPMLVLREDFWGVKLPRRPGSEKYRAPEGAALAVGRPGTAPFYFDLPRRIAQS